VLSHPAQRAASLTAGCLAVVNAADALLQGVETQQDFFDETKLPILLKTNGRAKTNPETKLPFAAKQGNKP
jgi:hypothetical protein